MDWQVLDYSRKDTTKGVWEFSQKAVDLIREYKVRFFLSLFSLLSPLTVSSL